VGHLVQPLEKGDGDQFSVGNFLVWVKPQHLTLWRE